MDDSTAAKKDLPAAPIAVAARRRILPLLATVSVMAIGIAAGIWQTGRANGKLQIEATQQARQTQPALTQAPAVQGSASAVEGQVAQLEYRQLRVKGEFVRDWPVYLENRPYNGKVGFYLLMPFKLHDIVGNDESVANGGARYLLVARGWFARDGKDRSKLPQIATPSGEVEIEGIIRRQLGHVMQLGSAPAISPQAIVQNAQVAEIASASHLPLLPYFLEQRDGSAPVADQLIRDWPQASSGVDKHRGYAFQWFGLAAAAFFFYVFTGFRRARTRN